jgi:hypothetical protein
VRLGCDVTALAFHLFDAALAFQFLLDDLSNLAAPATLRTSTCKIEEFGVALIAMIVAAHAGLPALHQGLVQLSLCLFADDRWCSWLNHQQKEAQQPS